MKNIFYNSFLLYIVIFSLWDLFTNKYYIREWDNLNNYRRVALISLLFFHHVIYFLIYFTIFFIVGGVIKREKSLYAYLGLVVCVVLHWVTNNNNCALTEWQNQIMNVKENIGFRDIYSIVTNTFPVSTWNSLRNNLYYSAIITNILWVVFSLRRIL